MMANTPLAPTTVTINSVECQKEGGCTVASSRTVDVAATSSGAGSLVDFKNTYVVKCS